MEELEARLLFSADSPVVAIDPRSLDTDTPPPLPAITQDAAIAEVAVTDQTRDPIQQRREVVVVDQRLTFAAAGEIASVQQQIGVGLERFAPALNDVGVASHVVLTEVAGAHMQTATSVSISPTWYSRSQSPPF